jgi:hypothetical protein
VKVGDLVEIEKWCKNKGRRAVVVRADEWDLNSVYIQYFDGDDGGRAMRLNLILISEA